MATKSDPGVNLFDSDTQQCPYEAYKTLRDEAPVYKQPGTDNMFVVTRYDDVREVLTNPARFPSAAPDMSSRAAPADMERGRKVIARFEEKGWLPAPTLAGRDDPNHKQMR
ncbi:MAG: cytochrome P450, partial [Pseudomonadota bacterium]